MAKVIRNEPLGEWLAKYSGKFFWVRLMDIRKGVVLFSGTGNDYLYLNDFSYGMDDILRELFMGELSVNRKVKLVEGDDFILVDRPEMFIHLDSCLPPTDVALIPALASSLDKMGITLTLVSDQTELNRLRSEPGAEGRRRFILDIGYHHRGGYMVTTGSNTRRGRWVNEGSLIDHMFKTSVEMDRYTWLSKLSLINPGVGLA